MPEKEKLLYISSAVIPSRFANSVHIMKMCACFASLGYDVTLLAPQKTKEMEEPAANPFSYYNVPQNFVLRRLPWHYWLPGRAIFYALQTAWAALLLRPDIIYGRFWPGLYLCGLAGLSYAVELHDNFPEERGAFIRFLFRKALTHKRLRHVVVNSDALRRHIESNYPNLEGNVTVARNGSDPLPDTSRLPRPFIRREGRIQAAYIGQLYEGRGMEILADLSALCPWADFHIVGGMDEDIARWKGKLAGRGNIFFHGYVPHAQTASFLKEADVLLAPYQQKVGLVDGTDNARWVCPIKLYEYMAAGKPILCSDWPILREVMRDGENGILCRADAPQDWADALKKLTDDKDYAAALGARAYKEFIENNTWQARAEKIISRLHAVWKN